jgi:hypothetical protein
MQGVAHFELVQLMSGVSAVKPAGFWVAQFCAQASSTQLLTHMSRFTQFASVAHAFVSVQHIPLMHVVHASSVAEGGQAPPPPVPPVPPVPVVVVAPVPEVPPPAPVVAEPSFPASANTPELLDDELHWTRANETTPTESIVET